MSSDKSSPSTASKGQEITKGVSENSFLEEAASSDTDQDDADSEISTSSKSFPSVSDNPFRKPTCRSDMVLVVEGEKLYVHKQTLSLNSPVFQSMFYGDFEEKGTEEIELKETRHRAMVNFLKQMYPVHSLKPIDDEILKDILPLADFYLAEHVRLKCEDYIGREMINSYSLHRVRIMMYLYMCDKFRLKHLNALLNCASRLSIRDIKGDYFDSLQQDTKLKLLEMRCQQVEKTHNSTIHRIQDEFSCPESTSGYPSSTAKCGACERTLQYCKGLCSECIMKKVNKFQVQGFPFLQFWPAAPVRLQNDPALINGP